MATAYTYQILSQVPDTEINPAGTGFMAVWKVTSKVTSGPAKDTIATALVEEQDHNADGVSRIIGAKVAQLSDIASLSGG
jgi:hypothetical protein